MEQTKEIELSAKECEALCQVEAELNKLNLQRVVAEAQRAGMIRMLATMRGLVNVSVDYRDGKLLVAPMADAK